MIKNVDMEYLPGHQVIAIKDIILMILGMVMVKCSGQMDHIIKEYGVNYYFTFFSL